VTYLGQLDNQTLVQTYNAADVLLAPSLQGFWYYFGKQWLVGHRNHLKCFIATGSSRRCCYLVDRWMLGNSKAVCRLQNDSAYRHWLIDKEIKRAQSFTWETTAEQVAKVYEKR